MDRHEVEAELRASGATELLTTAPLARLAYVGLDGSPRVIPIGFFWDGARVVVCTSTAAPKVRAITARPDLAFTIDVGSTPAEARALLVRGRATVETVDGVPDEYIAGASKSMDDEQVAAFRESVQGMYDWMVRIAVVPAWARFYDFGAGRLPATLQRLADRAAAKAG